MAALQPTQRLFALSMLSGIGDMFTGTIQQIEAELGNKINQTLSDLSGQLGPWQVVWGPAVFQAWDSNLADNVLFVARGSLDPSQPPRLVVSIAGTNPYSIFDWILEDGFVFFQAPWPYGSPPPTLHPKIALGTSLGLHTLQTLTAGPAQPGAGTTLIEFLGAAAPGIAQLTLVGHSLGGALSPTVALWLSDNRGQWDPRGGVAISVLPSAGPTPGNRDFAAYYDSQLGGATTRIHNSIDVVPHAWASPDLGAIPDLYMPEIKPDLLVDTLVEKAISISKGGNYAQIIPTAPASPGAVDTSLIDPDADDFENFFNQLKYQHVDEYFTLLKVQGLVSILGDVKQAAANRHDPLARLEEIRSRLQRRSLINALRQQ